MAINKTVPPDTSEEAIGKLIDRADTLIEKCMERLKKKKEGKEEKEEA